MGLHRWVLLFLFNIIMDYTSAVKDVPIHKMEALSGETIYLPCNVSTYEGDDAVLILWYREDKGTPIYSVDIRGGGSRSAKRWSDDTVFGNRAYFIFDKEPGELAIQNTNGQDNGVYRCRVDFLKAQTRNSKVNLTVISPPERVSIRDDSGIERSAVVGPYGEGDSVTLKCDVYGGKPTPTISWYRDGTPIVSETIQVPGGRYVQSEIQLGPLSREDLNTRLTCRANNHPRATPIESVVQIDMNFAPLNIRLLGSHQALSAGHRYDLLCQSAGSRPPAMITWWQDGQRLEKTTETTSSDGNQTTSTLSITLSRTDAGKYLSCQAYNKAFSTEPLEDGWKLDIQYVPETHVRLGKNLEPNQIREKTDVYFDCLVTAHPLAYKVEWRHNGRPLFHNVSAGVIISNHSLVLQTVSRSTAGNYSCVGFNEEGEGVSKPFTLNVLYAPTCMPNQPRVYGVAKQEDAKIKCTVDANPPDVEFKWTFNNSAESIDVAADHITRTGTSSTVTYTPITELDYGTLLCVATNKIGRQKVPCVFHIIAAGRPDQVHNCTLTNISMTSLTVKCTDGFNGGLPQSFMLEIKDLHSYEIKSNITSPVPRFSVASLTPGSVYGLSVYAFNTKGRSDPTILNAAMLRMPEKQLTEREKPHTAFLLSPALSLTIGLALAGIVAAFAVVLALRIPCSKAKRGCRGRRKDANSDNNCSNGSREGSPGPSDKSNGSKEVDGNESDEKNPDIIPDTIDSDDQIDYIRRRQHISTIDTGCSPTRGLLSSTSSNTPPPQKYNNNISSGPSSVIGGMTLHSTHNAIGYCTLRNGSQNPTSIGNLTMNQPPHVYSNSIATCTLPRHPNQMWPGNYVGGTTTIRHLQPIPSMHQLPQQQVELLSNPLQIPSTIALQHLGQQHQLQHPHIQQLGPRNICIGNINTGNLISGGGGGGGSLGGHSPNIVPSDVVRCHSSEDEVSVQTPLMVKRESTV
ncbi:hypothetical protein ACFFRR_006630 [Megaselia abdita]